MHTQKHRDRHTESAARQAQPPARPGCRCRDTVTHDRAAGELRAQGPAHLHTVQPKLNPLAGTTPPEQPPTPPGTRPQRSPCRDFAKRSVSGTDTALPYLGSFEASPEEVQQWHDVPGGPADPPRARGEPPAAPPWQRGGGGAGGARCGRRGGRSGRQRRASIQTLHRYSVGWERAWTRLKFPEDCEF